MPGREITAFNIVLSHGSMAITERRMIDFEGVIAATDEPQVVIGIITYVRSVNPAQVPQLVQAAMGSPNEDVRVAAAVFS
jgi:hypothetical protein